MAAVWSGQSMAQSTTPLSNTELSEDAENPVTRRITVPLRYEADFDDGAYKATKDTFEIDQAVVPFTLNQDWALITRAKLPAEALHARVRARSSRGESGVIRGQPLSPWGPGFPLA
jgi:hypothetical protein